MGDSFIKKLLGRSMEGWMKIWRRIFSCHDVVFYDCLAFYFTAWGRSKITAQTFCLLIVNFYNPQPTPILRVKQFITSDIYKMPCRDILSRLPSLKITFKINLSKLVIFNQLATANLLEFVTQKSLNFLKLSWNEIFLNFKHDLMEQL